MGRAGGTKDFATAARLGLEFGEDFELLEEIGWGEDQDRESFELTMPVHDLMELLNASMTKPSRCDFGGRGVLKPRSPKRWIYPERPLALYVRELRDAGEDLPYRRPPRSAVEVAARR